MRLRRMSGVCRTPIPVTKTTGRLFRSFMRNITTAAVLVTFMIRREKLDITAYVYTAPHAKPPLIGDVMNKFFNNPAMDWQKAELIINAYGLTQLATTDYLVADERRLPFPKKRLNAQFFSQCRWLENQCVKFYVLAMCNLGCSNLQMKFEC